MQGVKRFTIITIILLSLFYISEGLFSSTHSLPAEKSAPHKGYFD